MAWYPNRYGVPIGNRTRVSALKGPRPDRWTMGTQDDDPIEASKLLTQVVAAVIGTCPQTIGVYWGNATLVVSPPVFRSFAKEMLPDGLPLPIWIDFRVGPGENGKLVGFTHGMQSLGHKELETLNSPESPGGLRERLMDLCGYLLQNGPVIEDGFVVAREVIVTADQPRGVFMVDGVPLVPLLRAVQTKASVGNWAPGKVETALAWLRYRGLLNS